jgi:hypothetical protein
LRKITADMRDTNQMPVKDKIMSSHVKGIEDSNGKSDNGNVSTDISPDKAATTGATGANNDDISPEGLLEVISQEWKNEMERIK